jgi:bacterial/archaeal transporter family protein
MSAGTTRPIVFSLLTILMWGLWSFFGKLALEKRMPPTTVFLAEIIVSALIAVVLVLAIVQRNDAESLYSTINIYGILSGVALAVGLLFYYFALEGAKVTVVVPLTATYPVVAVLLAYVLLRERPRPLQWVGVILVVAGVALLLSGPSKTPEP